MHTKEDIEKAKQYLDNEGYGTGSNFTLNAVANLMAEYAAKNCVIPAVIKSVCYKDCGNTHPSGGSDNICLSCGSSIKQTVLQLIYMHDKIIHIHPKSRNKYDHKHI